VQSVDAIRIYGEQEEDVVMRNGKGELSWGVVGDMVLCNPSMYAQWLF